MMSCGWLWLYFGAFLMLMELASPGFVVFFFGLSASTVGLLRFLLGDAFSATWQLVAFSALSILYLAFLRRWMRQVFSGKVSSTDENFGDELAGRTGKVTEGIPPQGSGRALIGDAEWTAVADAPIAAGTPVRVVWNKNLTVKVEPVGPGVET